MTLHQVLAHAFRDVLSERLAPGWGRRFLQQRQLFLARCAHRYRKALLSSDGAQRLLSEMEMP